MKTDSLYRLNSSLVLMKKNYQRNMLIGLLISSVIVTTPLLVLAYITPDKPNTGHTILIDPPDTTIIDLTDIEIIRDISGGSVRTSSSTDLSNSLFIDSISIVDDQSELPDDLLSFKGNVGDADVGELFGGEFEGSFSSGGGGLYIQDEGTYYITDSLTRIPELIRMPEPIYPADARLARAEGVVLVEVLVGIDGSALKAKINSVSNEMYPFGEVTLQAALRAKFVPALRGNMPVKCWVLFPVKFRMEE